MNLPKNLTPGISLKVGLTQGEHRPYARVGGRLGIFSAGKSLDLTNGAGLLLAGAFALFAVNKAQAAKSESKAKSRKKKTEGILAALAAPVDSSVVQAASSFAKF